MRKVNIPLKNLDVLPRIKASESAKKTPPKTSPQKEPVKDEKPVAVKKPPVVSSSGAGARVSASGPYDEKRNGLPPWVIALIILVPVILVILYLFFWRDMEEKDSFTATQKEVVDTVASKPAVDSAAIQKAQEEEQLRKEQQEREKAAAEKAKTPRHHIIVGSFKEEDNAQNLMKSLKEKGFEQPTIFMHNNQYVVSADSYESLLEARDAQEKFLQQYRMENWVLTKKE
jgi:hypothetical protein